MNRKVSFASAARRIGVFDEDDGRLAEGLYLLKGSLNGLIVDFGSDFRHDAIGTGAVAAILNFEKGLGMSFEGC